MKAEALACQTNFNNALIYGSDSQRVADLFEKLPISCFKFEKEIINYAK